MAGTTALVSQSDAGVVGDGLSVQASISGGGSTLVFESDAENLTTQSADSTNWTGVYVTDNPLFAGSSGPNVINGTNGKGGLSIASLSEVNTDASGGVDATLVTFSGGTTVLLQNLLGVSDAAGLL